MGESFTLHEGMNYIGRGHNVAVQILGDPHISHDKHACIGYDPKSRKYFLVPGDNDGITYLDGKVISEVTEIIDLSHIRIGNTELLFRPLCGENFAWNTQWEMDLEAKAEMEKTTSSGTYSGLYENQLTRSYESGMGSYTHTPEVATKKPNAATNPVSAPATATDPKLIPIADIELDTDLFDPIPNELTK